MKRFMRGGGGNNASREQCGGRSGVLSPPPTHHLNEDQSTKDLPTVTRNALAMHTTSAQVSPQEAAKVALGRKAAAKQEAAKQSATKQAATRLEAERQAIEEAAVNEEDMEPVNGEDECIQAVDEDMVVPANARKKELIPNVFWFSKPVVASAVADSFRAPYNAPYMNWSEVPQSVRDRWYTHFKNQFTWKTEYDNMVRRDYEKKCKERLKGHVNKASKVPLHKPVKWMLETVRAELIRKREHPDFVKRSAKAKKNRYSNQSKASFDPGHRQGSISTIEVADRLVAEKNGVLPLAADVYEKTHGFEMPDGEKMLLGDKPKKTMAAYRKKLAEYNDKGVTKAPDEVFLEIVGGHKKGKFYGLGNASSMFYEVDSSSQTKQSTHAVSIISQLTSQLEECKKMVEESKKTAEESKIVAENSLKVAQSRQEEYEKEKGEWKKEKEELVSSFNNVKKVTNEVMQLILKPKNFYPRNPSKGGGGNV